MNNNIVQIKELETIIMRHLAANELMDNPFKDSIKHKAIEVAIFMKLKKMHFITLAYQETYSAFLNLHSSGKEINLLNLYEVIENKIVDTDILDIFDPHPNTMNLVGLISELLYGSWLRNVASQIYEIYNEADNWKPWNTKTEIPSILKNIGEPPCFIPEISSSFHKGLSQDWSKNMKLKSFGDKETQIKTSFSAIDLHLNNLMAGKFIVIAALAGCGKTALATNICLNIGKDFEPCLYITNEMDRYEIYDRMISTQSKVGFISIHKKEVKDEDKEKISKAYLILKTLPISICDDSNGSWEKAEAAIRRYSKYDKIRVVFLDYLQQYHLDKKSQSRVAELTEITARIKCLAMELKLTMIVMSQMNRAIYSRDDKTPVLADLKESGSIEQDADSVIFLQDAGKTVTAGKELTRMKVFVEKNRSGTRGDFEMTADLSINKFFSV